MKRVIRLTESDLVRIVKRVINEQTSSTAQASIELNSGNVVKIYSGYEEKGQQLIGKTPYNFKITTSPTTTAGLEKKVLVGGGLTVTALVNCANKTVNSLSVTADSVPDTAMLDVVDSTQRQSKLQIPFKGKQQIQSNISKLLTDKTVSANTFCRA